MKQPSPRALIRGTRYLWISLGLLGLKAAYACDALTVRDAAFEDTRDVHRLTVIANAADPTGQAIYDRLQDWLEGPAADLNVSLLKVAADDPDVHWGEYGIPSAPPSLPVVVLAGPPDGPEGKGRSFYIDHWEGSPTDEDLALLVDSPARVALRTKLGQQIAAILHVRGSPEIGKDTEGLLQTAVKKWSKAGKPGLTVVSVDRADPKERLLLSFIAVKAEGPDWVGIVFGRGKFMEPLAGKDITAVALNKRIESVTAKCTCLQDARSLGVDIPMTWDGELDKTVVPLISPEEAKKNAPALPILALEPPTSPGVAAALAEDLQERSGSDLRGLETGLWALGALLVILPAFALIFFYRKNASRGSNPTTKN